MRYDGPDRIYGGPAVRYRVGSLDDPTLTVPMAVADKIPVPRT